MLGEDPLPAADGDGFTITLRAPSIAELATLAARVSAGLAGVHSQPRSPSAFWWTPDDDARLRSLREARATWSEIAHALGRTERAVAQHWAKLQAGR